MVIDFGTLLVGTLLGLALGAAIVLFLIFAAVSAAKSNGERTHHNYLKGSSVWSYVARHEAQRAHLHVLGRDSDLMDW